MAGSRQILDHLFATGAIHLERGPLFDVPPKPLPENFDFDRVEGMMLGLAIGDALGITTETMLPDERRGAFGELRDYLPNRHVNERRGFPSDDTQLAYWTLEQSLHDDRFDPDRLADRFCRDRIFGLGSTVATFLANRAQGLPWHQCGPRSAGNGALMRIAPVLIPHLRSPSTELWADTALCAMVTHNDPGSTAACLAFVSMLWELLTLESAPEPSWWVKRYVAVTPELEGAASYRPRGGKYRDYEGPIWQFVAEKVPEAYRAGRSVLEACNSWYSGAYLLETVPSFLYVLLRHTSDPEEAIVRAVNDTKDNDTIAAIVGAAVGALHGRAALPRRWIDNLSGRTTDRDDGRVFELLEDARKRWAP